MDNQLVKPRILVQQIVVAVIVLLLVVSAGTITVHWYETSDPYVKQVLTIQGDLAQGKAIFQTNCAVCHGLQIDSSVGPSLRNVSKRKSRVGLIKQVINGDTPPMPKFQPNPQVMSDLLVYLETL